MKMRATYVLILANVIAFAMGMMWPGTLILYSFSHANWVHLAFNMIAILTFGLGVERRMGALPFVALYLSAVVVGGLFQTAFGEGQAVIGASAGVYGLLVVYAFLRRAARVLFLVIPMTAQALAVIAIAAELLMITMGWLPMVAHFAHLGGALCGLLVGVSMSWRNLTKGSL